MSWGMATFGLILWVLASFFVLYSVRGDDNEEE